MKDILANPYLSLLIRLFIGFLFIAAAVDKIAQPAEFAKNVANYHIPPYSLTNIVALTLPWLEFVVGLLLLFGVRVKAASILTSGMLIMFIILIASAMIRGFNISCGCFSQSDAAVAEVSTVGWKKIFEDIGLLLCSIYLTYFPQSALSLELPIPLQTTENT
ncbi:MAG: MauE/DoxX family redox-associated membrane protein [Candidatus Kapaibacterium sp.]|jgi:putative oxidoreductase